MKKGMLWLDDSKQRSLEEKVRRAAAYYVDKYGEAPQFCFVNQGMLTDDVDDDDAMLIDEIQVSSLTGVLPSHLWLGVPTPTA